MEPLNSGDTERRGPTPRQIILLAVTLVTTTIAGAEWMYGKSLFFGDDLLSFREVLAGLYFALPFLGILTVHEFGHFLTAQYHGIRVTWPYYIPLWLGFLPAPSIGTMGAFIRITGPIRSRMQFFDIGIAGPLAGFVVAIAVIFYGFTHLPPPEHIYSIHPEYEAFGLDYPEHVYDGNELNIALGSNLVFEFFERVVADPERVPNKYEMYHYPWLLAGYLALFFTALNLIPVGQLDGGHILYGLIGLRLSRIVSRALFLVMVLISGVGIVPFGPLNGGFFLSVILYFGFLFITFHFFEPVLRKRVLIVIWVMIVQLFVSRYWPAAGEYGFYLFFALLIGRFLGVDHPRALIDEPLGTGRKILGWIALVVFLISFTPRPIYLEEGKKNREEAPGRFNQSVRALDVVTGRVIEIF